MTMRALQALLCLWFCVLTVLASGTRDARDADCIVSDLPANIPPFLTPADVLHGPQS